MLGDGWLPYVLGNIGNAAGNATPGTALPEAGGWALCGASFLLTTTSGGSARTPILQALDGSGVLIAAVPAGFALTASSAAQYTFAYGATEWDAASSLFASGGAPLIPVPNGGTVRLSVDNGASGDTISAIRFLLWFKPNRPDREG